MPQFSRGSKYSIQFPNGVCGLSFVSADMWLSILTQLPYTILDPEDQDGLIPEDHRLPVLEATVALLEIVGQLTDMSKCWKDEDIKQLETILLPRLECTWAKIFRALSPTEFRIPKMHELRHFPRLIRLYGNPCNWDTGKAFK